MRVLHLVNDFPYPPITGATIRSLALLKAWKHQRWDLTFACFPSNSSSLDLSKLPLSPTNILAVPHQTHSSTLVDKVKGYFTTYQFSITNSQSEKAFIEKIRNLPPFDFVIAEELKVGRYFLALKKHLPHHFKKFVYVAHNLEANLFKQMIGSKHGINQIRYHWLKKFEDRVVEASDLVFAFSDEMKKYFQRTKSDSSLFRTRVCIDLTKVNYHEQRGTKKNLIFIGSLDYYPNMDGLKWFAESIWTVMKIRPPVIVAGSRPGDMVRQICTQNGFKLVDTPLDLNPILDEARLEIVPLRFGSGTRGKIIEALGAGIPVVSTTLGAEGLEVRPGEDIILCDDAVKMAQVIDRMFESSVDLEKLSRNGRRFATMFDGPQVAEEIARVLRAQLD